MLTRTAGGQAKRDRKTSETANGTVRRRHVSSEFWIRYESQPYGNGYEHAHDEHGIPRKSNSRNVIQLLISFSCQGQMNPYAQQQAMLAAQMAYQQTMMAMSQAGSQAGDFPDRTQSSSQLRSRQQPGADGRSVSPTGSMGGQTSPPPMGVPSFYGYPQGMGMSPQMGMGMPQMQMPWMISPGTMWGMPTPPTGPGSPMGQPRYDYMQPGNAGMGSEASSARGKNRGSSGEDLSQRVN